MALIEIDWKPDRKGLRAFSLVWMAGFGIVGGVLAWQVGPEPALWAWIAAAAVGLAGLAYPPLVRPVYLIWMGVALPLGWVMSHVLLLGIYLLLFTPIAVLFRLMRRDPLQRRPDPSAESYWTDRDGSRSPADYFRQF